MFSYDHTAVPPAPFLEITIQHPITGLQRNLPAKLDTAADISAIPTSTRIELALLEASTLNIEGYDGVVATIATHIVTLKLPQFAIDLQVIAIPESYALLGRDVLNHFYIKLNGPESTFDISTGPL